MKNPRRLAFLRPDRVVHAPCLGIVADNLLHIVFLFRGDWRGPVNDDVRQNLFVMERARDPALFPDDSIADHARAFQPLGFSGVVWRLSSDVGILAASKLVALAVTVSTLLLVVGAGHGSRMKDSSSST